MQEKGFNSKETHEQLKLLWENSADRGRVQYSSYRSFADTLNSLNEDGYNDDDIGLVRLYYGNRRILETIILGYFHLSNLF
jgi:hypothetical protein